MTTVANQGLPRTFIAPALDSMARASLVEAKNSEKEVRAIRATASSEVRARAETFMVMKTVATVPSMPKDCIPRAMPAAKIWKGVLATALPVASTTFRAPVPAVFMSENMMPAMMMARMPTKDSRTIAP